MGGMLEQYVPCRRSNCAFILRVLALSEEPFTWRARVTTKIKTQKENLNAKRDLTKNKKQILMNKDRLIG